MAHYENKLEADAEKAKQNLSEAFNQEESRHLGSVKIDIFMKPDRTTMCSLEATAGVNENPMLYMTSAEYLMYLFAKFTPDYEKGLQVLMDGARTYKAVEVEKPEAEKPKPKSKIILLGN